jgi:hypothetical protein
VFVPVVRLCAGDAPPVDRAPLPAGGSPLSVRSYSPCRRCSCRPIVLRAGRWCPCLPIVSTAGRVSYRGWRKTAVTGLYCFVCRRCSPRFDRAPLPAGGGGPVVQSCSVPSVAVPAVRTCAVGAPPVRSCSPPYRCSCRPIVLRAYRPNVCRRISPSPADGVLPAVGAPLPSDRTPPSVGSPVVRSCAVPVGGGCPVVRSCAVLASGSPSCRWCSPFRPIVLPAVDAPCLPVVVCLPCRSCSLPSGGCFPVLDCLIHVNKR